MNKKVLMLTLLVSISFYGNAQVMTSDNYCQKKHKSIYYRSSIKNNPDSTYIIFSHNFHSSTLCSKDSSFIQSKVFLIYGLPGDTIYVNRKGAIIQTWVKEKEFIQFPDSIFEFEMDRLSDSFYHHELLIH